MGALTSNQKQGSDFNKSPVVVLSSVDHQSFRRILKKSNLSVSKRIFKLKNTDGKSLLSRGFDALVSNSRNGVSFCAKKIKSKTSYRGNLLGKLGNFLRILNRCAIAKNCAFTTPRFCTERDGAFVWEEKGEQIKDLHEECFIPLTEEEEHQIVRAFKNCNRGKVLVSDKKSNTYITGQMLQCLGPRGWLNDEVINAYLELLKDREMREPQKFLKCHFFSSFFYKLISGRRGYSYKSVRRWTTQKKLGYNLLGCDKIFVPIHQKNHWCLAVINNKEKKFQYLDSLKGVDTKVLHTLARYYVDEVKDKNEKDIDVSSWKREFVRDLPEQDNRYDCGMFMIKYIDFFSRDLGLSFSQEDVPYFRKRTTVEILNWKAD